MIMTRPIAAMRITHGHQRDGKYFLTKKFTTMPGRGDNNKSGSAGRGASNQSNQPFVADSEKEPKSNHGKKTGGSRSEKMNKTKVQSANRNSSIKGNRE